MLSRKPRTFVAVAVAAGLLATTLGVPPASAQWMADNPVGPKGGVGWPDPTFRGAFVGGVSGQVYDLALQPDGKVVVGGTIDRFNSTDTSAVIRLNSDGSLDETFTMGELGGPTFPIVRQLELTAGGKIIIAGEFNTIGGVTRNGIARLNADGTVDPTFDPGPGFWVPGSFGGSFFYIWNMAVQPDGKILVAGDGRSQSYQGWAANGSLVRINTDGSRDTTFDPKFGLGTNLYSLVLQSTGKIIAGGQFDTVDSVDVATAEYLRFNADATLDNSFTRPATIAAGTATARTSSDAFFTYDAVTKPGGGVGISVNKWLSTGAADATFSAPVTTGFTGGSVRGMVAQPDGKLIVVGEFTKFNNENFGGIIRFNANGTVDTGFNTGGTGGAGFSSPWAVALQSDGKIILGGGGSGFNGYFSFGDVIRLLNTTPAVPNRQAAPTVEVSPDGTATVEMPVVTTGTPPASLVARNEATGNTCSVDLYDYSTYGFEGEVFCYIDGLDPEALNTFTVVGVNGGGESIRSRPSRAVSTAVPGNGPLQFTDIPPGAPYARAAQALADLGVTTNTTKFDPSAPFTRAQMVTFLWRMAGSPAYPTSCGVTDQSATPLWARAAVCWATDLGITANNPFKASDGVPRSHAAAFLWRYADLPTAETPCGLSDATSIPTFARQPACWLAESGIFTDNPFGPNTRLNRGQAAELLYKVGINLGQWLAPPA